MSVTFFADNCVEEGTDNVLVFPVAYSAFDPAELENGTGYLGTIGREMSMDFQFFLDGGTQFEIVGMQVKDLMAEDNGIDCTFRVFVEFDDTCDTEG